MSIESVVIFIVGLILLTILIIFGIFSLWEHYAEGLPWGCAFRGHRPIDEEGNRLGDPKGLLESLGAVFYSEVKCKRCKNKLYWINSYKIWTHKI